MSNRKRPYWRGKKLVDHLQAMSTGDHTGFTEHLDALGVTSEDFLAAIAEVQRTHGVAPITKVFNYLEDLGNRRRLRAFRLKTRATRNLLVHGQPFRDDLRAGNEAHAVAPPVRAERVAEGILRFLLPMDTQDQLIGDLLEKYRDTILPRFGEGYAAKWLLRHGWSMYWNSTRLIRLITFFTRWTRP